MKKGKTCQIGAKLVVLVGGAVLVEKRVVAEDGSVAAGILQVDPVTAIEYVFESEGMRQWLLKSTRGRCSCGIAGTWDRSS